MAITIVGDTHGKCAEFRQVVEKHPGDFIVQCGDMGAGFITVPTFPGRVKWIRGNHDDPAASRDHENYMGEYGFDALHNLFYVGGAWSIDWQWRKEWNAKSLYGWQRYKSQSSKPAKKVWWEDEELSYKELEKAVDLYKRTKPEIVVSHEAPGSIVPLVLIKHGFKFDPNDPMFNPEYQRYKDYPPYERPEKLECIKTRTSQALQVMLEAHRPKWWIFGHYHISKAIDTGSTLFKCCAELEPFTIPGS